MHHLESYHAKLREPLNVKWNGQSLHSAFQMCAAVEKCEINLKCALGGDDVHCFGLKNPNHPQSKK